MDGMAGFWNESDFIGRAVAALLFVMSVSSWVIIVWKGWLLRRAGADIQRGVAAFWGAGSVDEARRRLQALDRVQDPVPRLWHRACRPPSSS